jgi:hypothetical protein
VPWAPNLLMPIDRGKMTRSPCRRILLCAQLRRADGSYYPELFIDIPPKTGTLSVIDDGGSRTFVRSGEERDGTILFVEVLGSKSAT